MVKTKPEPISLVRAVEPQPRAGIDRVDNERLAFRVKVHVCESAGGQGDVLMSHTMSHTMSHNHGEKGDHAGQWRRKRAASTGAIGAARV